MATFISTGFILLLSCVDVMAYSVPSYRYFQSVKTEKKDSKKAATKIVTQSSKIKSQPTLHANKWVSLPDILDTCDMRDDVEISEAERPICTLTFFEKEPYTDIKELQKKLVYPDLAKRARVEGIVNVCVLVGKNGIPKKYFIESTDSPIFKNVAVRAVMSSVFTPALQNNQPIDCWVIVPVTFRLP